MVLTYDYYIGTNLIHNTSMKVRNAKYVAFLILDRILINDKKYARAKRVFL